MTAAAFTKLALSFPETVLLPHFDKTSFRVNKKIFATLDEKAQRATLMLTPADQSVFCVFDKRLVYAVPGKWGLGGATFFELVGLKKEMLKDALTQAYSAKAPKRLLEQLAKDATNGSADQEEL